MTDYHTKENRTISFPDSKIAYSFDISEKYVIGTLKNDSFDFEEDIFIYDINKDDLRILDQPVGMKGFISIYENKFIWIDYCDCQNIPLECGTMADNVNIYYYEI